MQGAASPSAAMEAMMQSTDADMMAVPLCSSVDIYFAEMMIAHHTVFLTPCPAVAQHPGYVK